MTYTFWILRPRPESKLWEPWYDKCFGFIIEAASEAEARQLAHEEAGDENTGKFLGVAREPGIAWLSSEHSTCERLELVGKTRLVMKDFANA